jgi:hypothetical protein
VPRDIPDEESRERIIFALLILRVLDIRHEDGDGWLRLSPFVPDWPLMKSSVQQAGTF